MNVDSPGLYWLLLLPLLIALQWLVWAKTRQQLPHLNVSYRAPQIRATWRTGLAWLPTALRLLGTALLIFAAARPYDWADAQWIDGRGVAIELIVDRSGSMRRDDYQIDDQRVTRLQAVADAAASFVIGDKSQNQRHQDMIGLVSFARQAETVCPLTLDHEQIVARLEALSTAVDYREDGTAIGDAIGVAVAELQSLQASLLQTSDQPLSQVIVLLTDGQQNAGQLSPEQATRLAKHYGIVLHAISLDPDIGSNPATRQRLQEENERLEKIAAATGGKFFSVTDTHSLRQVYQVIDALERRPLPPRQLLAQREYAVAWFPLGPITIPPLVLIGLVMLLGDWLLRNSILMDLTEVLR